MMLLMKNESNDTLWKNTQKTETVITYTVDSRLNGHGGDQVICPLKGEPEGTTC